MLPVTTVPGRPTLLPMLPPALAPGRRTTLPMPPGSGDALLLAQVAQARASGSAPMVVVTAEPFDAQRLADEIPFFAPGLRVALFPDWELKR